MTDSADLGARLRRQREGHGVSLQQVAHETKISPGLLADLEQGDLSQWPPGLYGRAFIRSYAEAVGLEPRDVLLEFLRLVPPDEGLPQLPLDPYEEPRLPGWTFSRPGPLSATPAGVALRLTLARPEAGLRRRIPTWWWKVAAGVTDGAMLLAGAAVGLLATGPDGWLGGLAVTAVVLVGLSSTVLGTTPGRRLFDPSWPPQRMGSRGGRTQSR